MPNRIIKESICTSDTIDELSVFEEVVFYRLIVNCDDFGRFDARPKVLSAKLFPLRDISVEQMQEAVNGLCKAGLIFVYTVDGRPYLQMTTWDKHQSKRAKKSKYPSPDESNPTPEEYNSDADESTCKHMQADESNCVQMSPYSYSYSRIENRSRYSSAHAHEDEHDNDERPDFNTLEVYAANNVMNMHGSNLEKLVAYREDMPDDLIRYAIDQANKHCRTGAPTFGYVDTILRGFVNRKINTVAQAEAAEAAREETKAAVRQGINGARSSPKKTAQEESDEFWANVPCVR